MPKAIMEPRSAQPQEPREAVVASNDEPKRIPAEAAQAPAVQEPAPVAPMPAPPIAVIAARPAPAPEPVKVAELPATPKEIVAPQPATASITETPAPQEKPLVHEAPKKEPAKKPEAPKAAEPVANEGEEPELWIKPSVGYGVRWYQIEQSGAFGGIKGSALAMNVLSFDTMVRYGAWNLDVGLEKFSSEFAGDTTDPTIKSDQPFKHFYLKPGYGIFFLGIDAQTSPIVRASGTTLQWTGLTTLSALAGIRKEWLFDNRRRKPFHLGFEVDGSYPLSVSGDGGAPSASSPSGYGASLRGYVEKSIIRRDEYRLNFGLDGTASYDKLNFNGDWAGSSGGTTRSILELGSKVYLGIEF
jgi:hypothetical protein